MQKPRPASAQFFTTVLTLLNRSGIPFLVGGGYALKRHTGLDRPAYDLDVFVIPPDAERVFRFFDEAGYRTELTFPHWLGKIYKGKTYADVIFSSGNGVARVDRAWFDHSVDDVVLGQPVRLCPAEESIWSKAFVMERDRYDGADVIHLLLAYSEIDWRRLFERFGPHKLVLLSHLILFLFVYPSEADRIPGWVWDDLLATLESERRSAPAPDRVCRGTLLSREQYLEALAQGYRDARLLPEGTMSLEDILIWTKAAQNEKKDK